MIIPIHHHSEVSSTLLGAKGAGLVSMACAHIPVPPGFIIPIDLDSDDPVFRDHILTALTQLETQTGLTWGDPTTPLLVSVRSGAAVSMPGMMDTFLNVGISPLTFPAIAERLESIDQAQQTYLRFLRSYGALILKVPPTSSWDTVESSLNMMTHYGDLSWNPHDHTEHLFQCIKAVKESWNSPRAVLYRQKQGLSHQGGTAVIVQAMVFGNGCPPSGTGVVFTRNPVTGDPALFGEYLLSSQGEDLVSGEKTPDPIHLLQHLHPSLYHELSEVVSRLESRYHDMQDVEFTIENGKLWILQTRSGKRTAQAAFKIAHDFMCENFENIEHILCTLDPESISNLLHPQLDAHESLIELGQGIAASPGAAVGKVIFHPQNEEDPYILIRPETSSEDMPFMMSAQGVVTLAGGTTSHAAVVMRGIGKPCITGLEQARWTRDGVQIGTHFLKERDMVTVDGTSGRLFMGTGKLKIPHLSSEVQQVMSYADKLSKMAIWANADTPEEIHHALHYGATGVGLCRTEHMMLQPQHTRLMHHLILASDDAHRRDALEKLAPLQKQDFFNLIQSLGGYPLTVRLLDPPLHEFLPHSSKAQEMAAGELGLSHQEFQERLSVLTEKNPMLGHRGCRLAITFPDIYIMQVSALVQAILEAKNQGLPCAVSLMIPFIMDPEEFIYLKKILLAPIPPHLSIPLGAMIEIPRAALLVHEIAPHVDFLSFGTNDLTQTTWGLSRDDSSTFMKAYDKLGIQDPFTHFDTRGVGLLMQQACHTAKALNPEIKLSVCGEHAGYPEAIPFFQDIGIDTLSCSPWRLLKTRLAAAQACIRGKAPPSFFMNEAI